MDQELDFAAYEASSSSGLMERRQQATTPGSAGGDAIGQPKLDEVKQALAQGNVWRRIADVASPDDPRRTQARGGALQLPFVTTLGTATTPGENTQQAATDVVYGMRTSNARTARSGMLGSVEWATDTVDGTHIPQALLIRVGLAELGNVTSDILADVPDSGIGPAALSRGNLLGLLDQISAPYRAGVVWMVNSSLSGTFRGVNDQAAGAWDNPFQDGDDPRLEGHRVIYNDAMPTSGPNTIIVVNPAWVVIDIKEEAQTMMSEETFGDVHQVYWKGWSRVGGNLTVTEAASGLNVT